MNFLHIYFNTFLPSCWLSSQRTLHGGNQAATAAAGDAAALMLSPSPLAPRGAGMWGAAGPPPRPSEGLCRAARGAPAPAPAEWHAREAEVAVMQTA